MSRRALRSVLFALLLSALPVGQALAHPGEPPAPHDLAAAWNLSPLILGSILLAGVFYAGGVRAVWRRAGIGHGVPVSRALAFGLGLLALLAALVSPLDGMAAALFSAHMLQHILLILVAAPLLVLGLTPAGAAWSVPAPWRLALHPHRFPQGLRQLWMRISHPLVAWAQHALVIWIWHAPGPYQAALDSEFIHALEHLSLLFSALLFWGVLVYPAGNRKLGLGGGLLYIFTTALHSGFLGALLTFSSVPWYPRYAGSTLAWGLSPLDDQQLAGVLMWVPAGTVYLGAALIMLGMTLQAMEPEGLPRQRKTME